MNLLVYFNKTDFLLHMLQHALTGNVSGSFPVSVGTTTIQTDQTTAALTGRHPSRSQASKQGNAMKN